jgi:REP element-mobilizing transposase RayT
MGRLFLERRVMPFNPDVHHRRSIRLQGYDYTQAGAYFVTICTGQKQCILGEVVDGAVVLSRYGRLAVMCWEWLAQHYPYVELDAWVVMPNHLHGIIVISDAEDADGLSRGGSRTAPTTPDATAATAPKRKTLGRLIGAFKTVSTKCVNQLYHSPGEVFWQRNYYEHIIRNTADLKRIREYILYNPMRWESDEYFSRPVE